MIRLPEGVELSLTLYLTSESTGLETRITLSGMPAFTEDMLKNLDVDAVGKTVSLAKVAPDWRAMTRAEIKDYKQREDSDNEHD